MWPHLRKCLCRVVVLTLAASSVGCAALRNEYGETCKTRAYVRSSLPAYVSGRYAGNAPVRFGVIPFSVPVNLASQGLYFPGLGYDVAQRLQAELLDKEVFPMVELLDRRDWPRKTEEFYSGNHGALERARAAGYDVVVVGMVNPIVGTDKLSADVKVMEAETGITLWFGKTEVKTRRPDFYAVENFFELRHHRPAQLDFPAMTNELAGCISDQLAKED